MASRDKDDKRFTSKFFQSHKKRPLEECIQQSKPCPKTAPRSEISEGSGSSATKKNVEHSSPENSTPSKKARSEGLSSKNTTSRETDNDFEDKTAMTMDTLTGSADENCESTTQRNDLISQKNRNPFAQFSFPSNSAQSDGLKVAWKKKSGSERNAGKSDDKKLRHGERSSSKKSEASSSNKGKSGWVRMADIDPEEQERIKRKWQSLADPDAPLEVRRFQVLVAARLHARCQEPVVRKAMKALRDVFEAIDESPGLCAAAVAKADPEVLANVISSIQYFNVKAKHIVKAAQEVQSSFGGVVPESEHSLKQLTGIGPVMADLLAFVNARAAYLDDKTELQN